MRGSRDTSYIIVVHLCDGRKYIKYNTPGKVYVVNVSYVCTTCMHRVIIYNSPIYKKKQIQPVTHTKLAQGSATYVPPRFDTCV